MAWVLAKKNFGSKYLKSAIFELHLKRQLKTIVIQTRGLRLNFLKTYKDVAYVEVLLYILKIEDKSTVVWSFMINSLHLLVIWALHGKSISTIGNHHL